MATDDRTSNFLAGRDFACELLKSREGPPKRPGDDSSLEAQYRDAGQRQNNWVLPFLDQLRARPELAEGFAAVLSDFLAGCGGTDVEVYDRLTVEEIFGEVSHG
jgi:hypothetical protein